MPHAFRSAALIEAETAQKKIARLRDRWASTKDSWYDGSVESVDRRLGWLREVEATAKGAASRLYASQAGAEAMTLLPPIRADRAKLEALRDRLAGGGAMADNWPGRDRSQEPFDGRFEHSQVQEWPAGSGKGWMPSAGDGPSHLHPVHGPYTPNPQHYPGPHPGNSLEKPTFQETGAPMGNHLSGLIEADVNPFGPEENRAWSDNTDPSGFPNHYTPNGKDWRTKLKNVVTGQPWNNGRVHTEDEIHQLLGPPPAPVTNPFQASVIEAAQEFVEDQNTSDRAELRIRAQRLMEDRTSSWDPMTAVNTVRSFVAAVDAVAPRPRRVASAPVAEVLPDFDDHLLFS